jgi:hypothetical protein
VGREDGSARGEDARSGDFAALDAFAQRDGIFAIRTGVHRRGEAGVRQHLGELAG